MPESVLPPETAVSTPPPVTFDGPVFDEDVAGAVSADPVYRIPPSGFERCLVREREADDVVSVRFDITAEGRPVNVRVVESTDACFDRSVVRAVEKWRYEPSTIDGTSVPHLDVEASLTFSAS